MVRKENLAAFESSLISEIKEAMPTKIGVHALDLKMNSLESYKTRIFYIAASKTKCTIILIFKRNFLHKFKIIRYYS